MITSALILALATQGTAITFVGEQFRDDTVNPGAQCLMPFVQEGHVLTSCAYGDPTDTGVEASRDWVVFVRPNNR